MTKKKKKRPYVKPPHNPDLTPALHSTISKRVSQFGSRLYTERPEAEAGEDDDDDVDDDENPANDAAA